MKKRSGDWRIGSQEIGALFTKLRVYMAAKRWGIWAYKGVDFGIVGGDREKYFCKSTE
jgi:hypothetical protein